MFHVNRVLNDLHDSPTDILEVIHLILHNRRLKLSIYVTDFIRATVTGITTNRRSHRPTWMSRSPPTSPVPHLPETVVGRSSSTVIYDADGRHARNWRRTYGT